jgi:histidinol-phosphate aminotransferase
MVTRTDMALSRRQLLKGLANGLVGVSVAPSIASAWLPLAAGASWPAEASSVPSAAIRLDRNDNPYGPSREVVAAIRGVALSQSNRASKEETERLRHAIATRHGVAVDHVVLGSGSSEILRRTAAAHLRPAGKLVVASPTFEWFAKDRHGSGMEIVRVPLTGTYEHDLDAMLARSGSDHTLVYVCNPNNPTGTPTHPADLEAFVRRLPATSLVLVDEAYHHYLGPSADYASLLDGSPADPRVIVTRTFSKIHGLARLRIGYAVAAPETIGPLRLRELERSVSAVSVKAALMALSDDGHVQTSLTRTTDDRQEFCNEANARMLRVIDSRTNFVMLNIDRPAAPVVEHFRKHNVVLPPPFAGFDHYIRVSLRTPQDLQAFWRVWDLMPGGSHGHR